MYFFYFSFFNTVEHFRNDFLHLRVEDVCREVLKEWLLWRGRRIDCIFCFLSVDWTTSWLRCKPVLSYLLFKNRCNFPFQKSYVKGITSLMYLFIWLLNSLIISQIASRNCHVLFTLLSDSHSRNIYTRILFNYLPVLGK